MQLIFLALILISGVAACDYDANIFYVEEDAGPSLDAAAADGSQPSSSQTDGSRETLMGDESDLEAADVVQCDDLLSEDQSPYQICVHLLTDPRLPRKPRTQDCAACICDTEWDCADVSIDCLCDELYCPRASTCQESRCAGPCEL